MDYSNNYSTSYGANGAADGGGFMPGEPQSSPAQGKGNYGKDTVRPLTIKQVLDAQQPYAEADFKVDGEPISQITFVGQIRSITKQPTNITYKVDDGTGLIEVKQWVEGDFSEDSMDVESSKPKLVEEGYCRVWGRLKAFNNKRHVGAHNIRPITDYNEINYHLLEATAAHLFFTRGPPSDAQTNGQKSMGTNGVNGGAQNTYTSAADSQIAGCSPLAKRVFAALKNTPQSNEGLHVQMIASTMGLPTSEVWKGAEELLGVGVIFTTVDDNTWAILDS
ncbi:hypothetical protein PV10_04167 [Exophiala mesophila]|uniref:Replication protein A C-terminal domain-containing protein n=1 Tax=Exophiala mesophila TaxID=212818 RepID=A0A0D2A1J8_EXOME|nr:uncharacterized protein PV10_04167 [Exophiala mesophila]KIV92908.1 hypothetical protein PV10_04167 [Exophiala mesophila]